MQIDLVSQSQHESLVDLMCELNHYYNSDSSLAREIVKSHLINNLLGADSPLRIVVACENERVLGFAAISLTYSLVEPMPDKCRQCQLKELYVLTSARGRGIGTSIMSWVAQYAMNNGCHRIDWPVKANNARGISFYTQLGAQQVIERISFRISEPNLSDLANKNKIYESLR
jgi:GNAT superfamily N-acetyltransferase